MGSKALEMERDLNRPLGALPSLPPYLPPYVRKSLSFSIYPPYL